MEQLSSIKLYIATVLGAVGGFIANIFGGWTTDMQTLLIFMAVDFVLGLALAMFFQNSNKSDTGALNSTSAWKGLCKKCVSFLVVLVAHRLDITLGLDYIKTAVIVAFIVVELISIIENLGLMGIPVPKIIVQMIDVLKQKAGEVNGDSASTINKK